MYSSYLKTYPTHEMSDFTKKTLKTVNDYYLKRPSVVKIS